MNEPLPESACIGCQHNVGEAIVECVEPVASSLMSCFNFVSACAWREDKETA